MKITTRPRRPERSFPACDARVLRLAGPGHVPSDSDRCPRCGGTHLLIIEEVIVSVTADTDHAGAAADRGGS